MSGIASALGKPFTALRAKLARKKAEPPESRQDGDSTLTNEPAPGETLESLSNTPDVVSGSGVIDEPPSEPTDLEGAPIPPPPSGGFFRRALDGARLKMSGWGGQMTALAATLKEKFPKNLDDLKKLQTDEAIERIRQVFSGGNAATYLRLSAAAFAAYFMADTVSLFTDSLVPDAPPVPAPRITRRDTSRRSMDEYAAILTRNIFNSQGLIPEPAEGGGPARKTNLPLNLIGTVVLKDELKSIAAIEDKSQNLVFPVRVDDTISEKVKITKIERFKVYFINRSTGYTEYVEIIEDVPVLNTAPAAKPAKKGEGGITQNGETNYELERGTLDKAVGNLSEVLQQARAIPNFENGMPDGYKIIQIVPGSIYDQLGIKNGDVVCGLNNEPINDPGKAFQFFNELKSARHVEICVKRGGRKMTMNYDIRG